MQLSRDDVFNYSRADSNYISIDDALNYIGNRGWELVCATNVSETLYIFKRERVI